MAGFMDSNTSNLFRTNIWSRQIKELLLDELNAMKWVRIISDFPDGFTINIPSIGEASQQDFVEGRLLSMTRWRLVILPSRSTNTSILPTRSPRSSREIASTLLTLLRHSCLVSIVC